MLDGAESRPEHLRRGMVMYEVKMTNIKQFMPTSDTSLPHRDLLVSACVSIGVPSLKHLQEFKPKFDFPCILINWLSFLYIYNFHYFVIVGYIRNIYFQASSQLLY